ncbi:MAG: response regulator [Zoogloeaceae bacterium]|nr:response regulator [Zoogloeaceae bacterium]
MPARILVVEDNEASLELVRYLLAARGHQVLTAEDGGAGLRLARTQAIDLVISDLQMPNMDGYEFLAGIRADTRLQGLKVIAVTAFSMTGDRNKILVAGFDGYLAKPIDPETFSLQIEEWLPPDRAGHESPRHSED